MKRRLKKWNRAIRSRVAVRRLARVVREIEHTKIEKLANSAFHETKIRQIGLRHDERGLYGDDGRDMNFLAPGFWQIPGQLAGAMALLARQRIATFLEVGTADGFTFSYMAACLSRLNPGLKATTIDINPNLARSSRIAFAAPVEFVAGKTSDAFAGRFFDLVFIDGNHSYEWVFRDYQNVGRQAAVCMFHDINDRLCGDQSVPRFWTELKLAESEHADFHEFLFHSSSEKVMGIGIRIRKSSLETAL